MKQIIQNAIDALISDFKSYPQDYFTEEDVRWRLMGYIKHLLSECGKEKAIMQGGRLSIIHGEYPTPFKCDMRNTNFVVKPKDSKGFKRGHFDIAILNPDSIENCDFEIIKAQSYERFLPQLPNLKMPFVEAIIELMLFRDMVHANKTDTPEKKAEFAVQDIRKTIAVLTKQDEYYDKPFTRNGFILLMDNSELVTNKSLCEARKRFINKVKGDIDWQNMPKSLEVTYVYSGNECRFSDAI